MERNRELNSFIETDTGLSFSFIPQDETILEGHIALGTKNYELSFPPKITREKPPLQPSTIQTGNFYQCARSRNDSDSGSDSAKEETSPYSSLEDKKFEAQVLSNKDSERREERKKPAHRENVISYATATAPGVVQSQQSIKTPGLWMQESNENFRQKETLVTAGSVETFPRRSTFGVTDGFDRAPLVPRRVTSPQSTFVGGLPAPQPPPGGEPNQYEDASMRLITFLGNQRWPHEKPSAEQMAEAGMFYLGVVRIKGKNKDVYDMVECYKCHGRMQEFKENDDPREEHRRLYPKCV